MTDATANPAAAGSDSAPPSITLDDAANLDFYEPDEDEANAETGEVPAKSDEGEDAEIAAQTDEEDATETGDDEDEGEPNPDGEAQIADENMVFMVKGEPVSVKEMSLGYLREADYRRKSQVLSTKGKALDENAARVSRTADAIANFLASQLPEEPTRALAIQDPAEYTRRKALFDAGLEQIGSILSLANEPKEIAGKLSEQELEETLAKENGMLLEALPELEKPEARQKFFADAFEAGKEAGFTEDEMREINDHRYFIMANWALKGRKAEQDRKTAMAKVNNAPVLPPKGKQNGKAAQNARKSNDAMKRLDRTGSIKDAMLIDFD